MSDLISRKALIEALVKAEEECEEAMTVPSFATAIYAIRSQPTAYDPDRVVAVINNWRDEQHRIADEQKAIYRDNPAKVGIIKDLVKMVDAIVDDIAEVVQKGGVG